MKSPVRGMGRIFVDKRTNIYMSDFYMGGKRFVTSTGIRTPDEKAAWKIHMERWHLAHQGLLQTSQQRRVTCKELFSDLLLYYSEHNKSTKSARYALDAQLIPFFGHIKASEVTAHLIDLYKAKRHDHDHISNDYIRYELSLVRRAFTLAQRKDKVQKVPYFDMPPKGEPRTGFYEWSEAVLLSQHVPDCLKNLVLFFFLTGWRYQEALKLEWHMVDLDACTMQIPGKLTKNGQPKINAFDAGSRLHSVLLAQRQYRSEKLALCPFVFHRDGKRIVTINVAWKRAHEAAKIPLRTVHDMRRSLKRITEMAGVSETYSMKLMGHESVSVSRAYAVGDAEALRDANRKIDAQITKMERK